MVDSILNFEMVIVLKKTEVLFINKFQIKHMEVDRYILYLDKVGLKLRSKYEEFEKTVVKSTYCHIKSFKSFPSIGFVFQIFCDYFRLILFQCLSYIKVAYFNGQIIFTINLIDTSLNNSFIGYTCDPIKKLVYLWDHKTIYQYDSRQNKFYKVSYLFFIVSFLVFRT